MRKLSTIVVAGVCLAACLGVFAGEATGPPKPVPYKRIVDPADDDERHITVTATDRGPVWLLTGFLGLNGDIDKGLTYEPIARVKPKHARTGAWPFWSPVSITQRRGDKRYRVGSPVRAGKYLDTMLRLRETGMKWQLILHFKGRYSAWYSFMDQATEAQLKDYYDHIYTLVKYCRNMGLPVDFWEVTNEPAHPYNTEEDKGGYFKHSWQDLLDFWDVNYDAIRAADPKAKIVGPSYGGAGKGDMVTSVDAFLAHCKEKGQKLDVLSWHINCIYGNGPNGQYMVDVDGVQKEIEDVKKLVETKYPMVGVEAYHIDETGYYLPQTGIGAHIAYFYYMDLAGLDRAAKTGPPYMMSGTRISPDTPRAAYWAWVDYAKQDGGVRLITETDDRNLVCLASRHDDGKIVRALVARAKKQEMADPPESASNWKWGDSAPAKPPVSAKIDFEGIPLSGPAEVTILHLPSGDGPFYENDLDTVTTTTMMNVTGGKLTVNLQDIAENNVVSIVIGPKGTRAQQLKDDEQWQIAKPTPGDEPSERELHQAATAKAEKAAAAGTIRIACGALFAYTDPAGNGWFGDQEYVVGKYGNVSGGMVHRGPIEITGTDNPEIYRTELYGPKSYHITLPNGKYLVRLHWAETYGADRDFGVTIEGETVLEDFNPMGEAGGKNKAFFREFTVQVEDGVLDIGFPLKKVMQMINAIEVIQK